MDHYDALGIDRNASVDEVRREYRRRAQKAHPDKPSGNAEKFHAIQKAYDVLSDSKRRAAYDSGEAESVEESIELRALKELGALIIQQIERTPNIDSVDIIANIRNGLRQALSQLVAEKEQFDRKITRYEKAKKNLRRNESAAPIVEQMIEAQIGSLNRGKAQQEDREELVKAIQKLLRSYSYEVSAPMPRGYYTGTTAGLFSRGM